MFKQVCQWPVVHMSLGYNNNVYSFNILKVDDLPFPVLLGRDATEISALLQAVLPWLMALVSDDEELRPSRPRDHREPLTPATWSDDSNFQNVQEKDPTLARIREDIAICDGDVVDADFPTSNR